MNLFLQLRSYLDNNFEGLELTVPLFYKSIPGLRFDLQDESDRVDETYFKEVQRRMDLIYEETSSHTDEVFLLYRQNTWKRGKIRKYGLPFKLLNVNKPQFRRRKAPINNDHLFNSCQLVVSGLNSDFNFSNLFGAIANMDFPSRVPRITGELYILNITRGTITMMYDDRGCDIVSYDVNLLQQYYKVLNSLILEYDRPDIIQHLGIIN